MSSALPARFAGLGLYIPPTVETAEQLAPRVGRSAEWIRSRTGVQERRISDMDVAQMAALAAKDAVGDGPPPDAIINCGVTPSQLIPDTAPLIEQALGWSGIPAWSIHATCLGFMVSLHTAAALLQSGAYTRILLVAAERGSLSRDMSEPESGVLIGDGAAAAVLTADPSGRSAMLSHAMATFPEGAKLAELRGFGARHHPNDPATIASDNLFRMDGPRIYKMARKKVGAVLEQALQQAGVPQDQIDLVVPHQASGPGLAALSRMGFSHHKVVNVVGRFGNCIAASIPMALAVAHREGRLQRGNIVLFIGTGAGLSVAASVWRW